MNCTAWCLAAYGILGAFIGSQFAKTKTSLFSNFDKMLSPNQKTAYLKIIRMRSSIFTRGLLIGLLVSFIVVSVLYKKKVMGAGKITCLVISVTLITCYLFYQIHPKPDYILKYLDSREQIQAWWNIYRTFRSFNYLGIVFGILLYMTVGCSLIFDHSQLFKA